MTNISRKLLWAVVFTVLLSDVVWATLCFPGVLALSPFTTLVTTLCLLLAGLALPAAVLFFPDVPRLPGEKGRLGNPLDGFWGFFFSVIGIALAAWDLVALEQGRELLMEQSNHCGFLSAVLAPIGHYLTLRTGYQRVCWNVDGILFRTVTGRIHRYGWTDVTHYSQQYRDHQSTCTVYAGYKGFTVTGSRKEIAAFLSYVNKRRMSLGLLPMERKYW